MKPIQAYWWAPSVLEYGKFSDMAITPWPHRVPLSILIWGPREKYVKKGARGIGRKNLIRKLNISERNLANAKRRIKVPISWYIHKKPLSLDGFQPFVTTIRLRFYGHTNWSLISYSKVKFVDRGLFMPISPCLGEGKYLGRNCMMKGDCSR